MGHKKHSTRKSKNAANNIGNNSKISPPEPSLEIAKSSSTNSNNNTTDPKKQSCDVNQYLYNFISSDEFNSCYPIIAFQSSVLLTCVELQEKQTPENGQSLKIPVRELLINAEKRIKNWEERARNSL